VYWTPISLVNGHRSALLRSSLADEGPFGFVRLFGQIVRDQLLYRKILVFALNTKTEPSNSARPVEQLQISSFESWDSVPPNIKTALHSDPRDFWWDPADWMARGWRLWVGLLHGQVVSTSWTRGSKQAADFWFPIGHSNCLIWETVTVRGYRRRGIFTAMLAHIVHQLHQQGCHLAYISCLESNIASRRGIQRCGFQKLGYVAQWKWGAWKWFPEVRVGLLSVTLALGAYAKTALITPATPTQTSRLATQAIAKRRPRGLRTAAARRIPVTSSISDRV